MTKLSYVGIQESYDLHWRVAHILTADGWLYVHEYRGEGRGQIDFIALNPVTGHIAIIECKVDMESVDQITYQVNRYHKTLGIESALKWVFTLAPISKKRSDALVERGIECSHIDRSIPLLQPLPAGYAMGKFNEAFIRVHRKQPLPHRHAIPERLSRTVRRLQEEHDRLSESSVGALNPLYWKQMPRWTAIE